MHSQADADVQWLQYIVRYLLHRTNLRKPRIAALQRTRRARAPRASDIVDPDVVGAYEGLMELEEVMKVDFGQMESAGDIVKWGRGKGFVEE